MNHRKLAFFSMSLGLVFGLSFVPVAGLGLSMYATLMIWAVLGFRWWLGGALFSILMEPVNALMTAQMAPLVQKSLVVVGSVVPPPVQPFMAPVGWLVFPGFFVLLWLVKSDLRKMLLKRIPARRLP